MKGILKGIIFTELLFIIFLSAGAAVSLNFANSDMPVKIFLWGTMCLSVFIGALVVCAGANEKRALKGIITALLSIFLFCCGAYFICRTPLCRQLLSLCVCMVLCGVIGSFVGSHR